jgi:hypothetical protein
MKLIYNSNDDTIRQRPNDAPSKVKLVIHHQLLGIELVSPMYVSDGATCYLLPEHRVRAGSTVQVGFKIDLTQGESVGVLMYKLQRKCVDQSNVYLAPSEEVTCTLLIIWNVNNTMNILLRE